MKKKILLSLSLLLLLFYQNAAKANRWDPRATFDSVWVDYDISENSERGMRIHLKFSTYEMKDMDAYVAIYFYYNDERGGYLKDKDKKYQSADGEVALYKSIRPGYDATNFDNLEIFMPYNELDLPPGVYQLGMDIKVIYQKGGIISQLSKYNFKFTNPETTTKPNSPDASLENMWVDYDVTENGRYGMRIHVKFKVYNLKDADCDLAVYFEKNDGTKLLTNNEDYRSESGQVTLYKSLKPGYDETVYSDMQVFMPYDELNLGKGKFDLRMDADVIYKDGDIVKHLKYYDFQFSQ